MIVKSFGPTKNVTDLAKMVVAFMGAPNLGASRSRSRPLCRQYLSLVRCSRVRSADVCSTPPAAARAPPPAAESPLDVDIASEMTTDLKAYEEKAKAAASKAPNR